LFERESGALRARARVVGWRRKEKLSLQHETGFFVVAFRSAGVLQGEGEGRGMKIGGGREVVGVL
jgi:hypothetical protein